MRVKPPEAKSGSHLVMLGDNLRPLFSGCFIYYTTYLASHNVKDMCYKKCSKVINKQVSSNNKKKNLLNKYKNKSSYRWTMTK